MLTKKAFIWLFEVRLCDLSLDTTDDCCVAETDEGRAISSGDGTDVYEEVSPSFYLAAIWANLFSKKAFEICSGMKSLKYLCVEG